MNVYFYIKLSICTIVLLAGLTSCTCNFAESYQKNEDYNLILGNCERSIFEIYQQVLRNEFLIRTPYEGIEVVYLEHFSCEMGQPFEFAVVDMDHNGIAEIILNFQPHIRLVLHYFNGEIFGHSFGSRSMGEIKTDGTFIVSFGASGFSTARLDIFNGVADIEIMDTFDFIWHECPELEIFRINDVDVSLEEYNEWFDLQDSKDNVTWFPLSQENIENLLSLAKTQN